MKLVVINIKVKKKSRNKIVEILAKLKNRNLPKFRFVNLFNLKKVKNSSTMTEPNFLSSNAKVVLLN